MTSATRTAPAPVQTHAQAQARAAPGPAAAANNVVDLDDIQGLLRHGHARHTEACFLLLRIGPSGLAQARDWLAQAPVTCAAAVDPLPDTLLQVALGADGLRALGVAPDIVAAFSAEFLDGMAGNPDRSRRLGDAGSSDPVCWDWGAGERVPHVLVLLYALPGRLEVFLSSVQAQLNDAGFELLARLDTSDLDGVEPFGFADGISQPEPDWERRRPVADETRLDYGNLSCLGEFVLGYPNEYGLYTDRPLLDPARAGGLLPPAEDAPQLADLGRNGSYLVLRQLRQDVRGFWRHLDRAAGGDPELRTRWAEAMVGRTMDGRPLVGMERAGPAAVTTGDASGAAGAAGVPDATRATRATGATGIAGRAAAVGHSGHHAHARAHARSLGNDFTYRLDPDGLRCPFGAHIRRANPRNADLPPGGRGWLSRLWRILGFDAEARRADLIASTRFHRLLRRGREYGPALPAARALAGASGADVPDAGNRRNAATDDERGLHFICLGADIGRQFEFVQGAWLASTKFGGLAGESDPLLGRREPGADGSRSDVFSMPQPDGPDLRLAGLPEFVTVVGGGYFFLPGIRALRYLAAAR